MMDQIKKFVALCMIYLFNLFPIKHNKVFLFSYYGNQYGCNPKYISNYIVEHYPRDTFDVVWAFHNPESKIVHHQVRKVKTMSIRYFYELCTSKVVITNFRTTNLFKKRKNQYYIQTWHSSLRLKQIEKDAETALPESYIRMAKKDSEKCDLLLSGCRFSTTIFKKSFWYAGEIFEHGTPRNDVLLHDHSDIRKKIFKKLNISEDKKVVLYAPTFRDDNNLSVYDLDYARLREKLATKFGGEWIVLVKLHPHLISIANEFNSSSNIMNVTDYDDIQELLSVADILITDYSSLMFDFAITTRPCFLYVSDLEKYQNKERGLYFDVMELPFIHAKSNKQLWKEIDQYHQVAYQNEVATFLRKIGTYEDGKANEALFKRIDMICFQKERDETYEAI